MTFATNSGVWINLLVASALFVVALALRMWRLGEIPPGLYNDEAAYALDALHVLGGEHSIFFERNNGREPLFIYLAAFVFNFFGPTPYALRSTAAVLGALTAPAAFYLAWWTMRFDRPHETALARWAGVWVGLFVAFSYWHLSFSRLGFRAITLPLVMSLAFIFVWRLFVHLRENDRIPWSDALLSGVLLGLTFYTYTAGRAAIAVFGVAAALVWWRAKDLGLSRRLVLQAAATVSVLYLLVIAPLASYFLTNPDAFGARAVAVSIFNPRFAPDGAIAALVNSGISLARMFFDVGDPNIRHNPALRPVFDPLLALWLVGGIVLAFVSWRRVTALVYVAWIALLATPALISAEGMPHSLRAIGMMPAVFVLSVWAMIWVGERLFKRRAMLVMLLPLPFLVISGVTSVSDYFGAWNEPVRFRSAFMVDEMEMLRAVEAADRGEQWLLPLSPGYFDANVESYLGDFLLQERVDLASVLLQEESAAETLATVPATVESVNFLHPTDKPEMTESSYIHMDAKRFLDFLLRKSGARLDEGAYSVGDIPYSIYHLGADRNFTTPPLNGITVVDFGDAVRLLGVAFNGAEAHEPLGGAETATIRADQPLWVVLEFDALRPIDIDLKTSILLRNEDGRAVAQSDGLLVGDRYPVERVWEAGESTHAYAILDLPPGLEPGEYSLDLRVYEDASGRVLPVKQDAPSPLSLASLGLVHITPPRDLPDVLPQVEKDGPTAHGVALIGIDPLPERASPGEHLPLTLLWRAQERPSVDLTVRLQLVDAKEIAVATDISPLGDRIYPTNQWRLGETIRQLPVLGVPADAENGVYTITVALLTGGVVLAEGSLGEIVVEGRQRLLEQPPVETQVRATFGDIVSLVGAQGLEEASPRGDLMEFKLVWQVVGTPDVELVRFVQLIDEDGRLVAQQDTIPCETACPASSWLVGEYLIDKVAMHLPESIEGEGFRILVGWYGVDDQQRLSAVDDTGASLPDYVVTLPRD